jgi:hypothetical protein
MNTPIGIADVVVDVPFASNICAFLVSFSFSSSGTSVFELPLAGREEHMIV